MKRATRTSASAPRAKPAAPRTRAAWGWAITGALLGAVLATALWAPARWLSWSLAQASGGKVLLLNARGTVWQGSAQLVLSGGTSAAHATRLPGRLGWTLGPRWLGLGGTLDVPCCATQPIGFGLNYRAGLLQFALSDSQSQWPAALLTGLGAPWNTLKPEGTLTLHTRALQLGFSPQGLRMAGEATLDATHISSSLATLRPMGSYRMVLSGGQQPSLLLTTLEGALQLNGSGLWTERGMRFSGEASAAAGSESALSNLLNIIGRRDGARSIINLS